MKFELSKQSKKILLPIVIFDFLFLGVAYILIQLFNNLIITQYNKLFGIDYDTLLQQTTQQLEAVSSTMQGTLFMIILLIIIFILLIFVNCSFFQGLVYSKILKKKFNLKKFWKFLLLNIVWTLCFAVILAIVQKAIKYNLQLILTTIILLSFIYFTHILFILFIKNNKIQVKKTFRIGALKFYKLAIPYVLLIIILLILRQLNIWFQYAITNIPIHPIIKLVPFAILALIAIDIARVYTTKTIV